ncbi:MAG: MotA/TolQ/ExbB proton channel family protein [Treponema sp.]|nr:MotA/TolQ/ExbB proton channel family protein [Treponema sp.]
MKIIQFVNLGGAINWLLFLLFWAVFFQCTERILYFFSTRKNSSKSFFKKFKDFDAEDKNQLENEISRWHFEMNRGLWFLDFCAAASPSAGLLGTITGLIKAFQSISAGNMNMENLSEGIWVAMLTTASGLAVSIPAMFFYRFFKRIIEKRMAEIYFFTQQKETEKS